jgi:hypothetical protein
VDGTSLFSARRGSISTLASGLVAVARRAAGIVSKSPIVASSEAVDMPPTLWPIDLGNGDLGRGNIAHLAHALRQGVPPARSDLSQRKTP